MNKPKKQLLIHTLLVYALGIGTIKLLYELRFIPFIQAHVWSVALIIQVYVPIWLVQQQGRSVSAVGFHTRRWRSSLTLFSLCSFLFFVPSVVGNHLWQTWLKRKVTKKTSPLRQLSPAFEGTPGKLRNENHVQLYSPQHLPFLIFRWKAPLSGTLKSDGEMKVLAGWRWIQGSTQGNQIKVSGGSINRPAIIKLRFEGTSIHMNLKRDGKPIQTKVFRLGSEGKSLSKPIITRNYLWILFLLLTQIFLVALPEELFYRGYLLEKFDLVWQQKQWSFAGFSITLGNLVTSILFAITHFLIGHQPYRLAVFFPSLLFGYLKQKNHSLLAPVLFHAFCNVLMKLLEPWYQ